MHTTLGAPLLAFILHPMHALYTNLTSWSLCQSLLALPSHLLFTGARRHPCLRNPTQATFVCFAQPPPPIPVPAHLSTHTAPALLCCHTPRQASILCVLLPPSLAPALGLRARRETRHACNMHRRHLDLFTPLTQPTPTSTSTWAPTPIHAQSLTSVPHSSPNNHRQLLAGTPSPAPDPPPQSQSKPSVNIAR